MSSLTRCHAIFHGRVQGVAFRYNTQLQARSLGLVGTVKNLSDGTVDLIVEGEKGLIKTLIQHLSSDEGPGRVERVASSFSEVETLQFSHFQII